MNFNVIYCRVSLFRTITVGLHPNAILKRPTIMYMVKTNYIKVRFVYDVDQFSRFRLELLFKDNLVIQLFQDGNNVNFKIIFSHDFASKQ